MIIHLTLVSSLLCLQIAPNGLVLAGSVGKPTVRLDMATFVGTSSGDITQYLGVPFAQPPVGNLRFRSPRANRPYTGIHNATVFGSSCVQQTGLPPIPSGLTDAAKQFIGTDPAFGGVPGGDEDCLTVNVVAPSGLTARSKLPVLVWIYGGGFANGESRTNNGSVIVQRSLNMREPVIFVSLNYRISALGFLGSAETQKAGVGNLGLEDQRQALRWVQKYICSFGGDPEKVTIWGASAGAMSVALQTVTNGGNAEGLFRAAFMHSGSPIPVGSASDGQRYYDALIANVGCSTARDTLQCLREAPIERLRLAIQASPDIYAYQSFSLAWLPRVDGKFLKDSPQKLALEGSVAKIPLVSGNCDDEGTLFSLGNANITTDQEVHDYMRTIYFPAASNKDVDGLLKAYPNETAQGSPFDTGNFNAVTPQFKRLAAIQGDLVFQAPRRFFMQQRASKQPVYSFLSKRLKSLSDFGSIHGSDIIANVFGPGDLTDYLIRFAATLDPNGKTGIYWPRYTNRSPKLLTFLDGPVPLNVTLDTFRADGMKYLTKLSLAHPSL